MTSSNFPPGTPEPDPADHEWTRQEVNALLAPLAGVDMDDIAFHVVMMVLKDGRSWRSFPGEDHGTYIALLLSALTAEFGHAGGVMQAQANRITELEALLATRGDDA